MSSRLDQIALKKHDEVNASADMPREEAKKRDERLVAVNAKVLGAALTLGARVEHVADDLGLTADETRQITQKQ